MMANPLKKEDIRRLYLERRRRVSPHDWRDWSRLIFLHLEQNTLYQAAETILTYVSAKDNEVDTHQLIDHALAQGKKVLIPVLRNERGLLDWVFLRDRSLLKRGAFGLFEPVAGALEKTVPPPGALCLTPGVAFTRRGDRIGYGGGYYDRFLKSFSGTALGLAFEMQITAELPSTPLDFRLAYLVTEKRVIQTDTPDTA